MFEAGIYNRPDKLNLENLIDPQLLKRLLDSFTIATNLLVSVTDTNGNCVVSSQASKKKFCSLVKECSGSQLCQKSYKDAGEQAAKWNEPYIFRCHAGLIVWACPVFSNKKHIANLISGQVLMWQQDDYFSYEIKSLATRLKLDEKALLESMQELKIISAPEVQSAADLLSVTANYLSQGGLHLLDYQQKLRTVGSWIWVENNKQKNISFDHKDTPHHYLLKLESEIIQEIRVGNLENAKKILEKLVLKFFVYSKGRIEVYKGLSMEFIGLLVRLSTESEMDFNESIRISSPKFGELEEADTLEKVMLWLLNAGNSYIEELLAQNGLDNGNDTINKAVFFIQNNFTSATLSLAEVSKACFISPAYLSRLFKKEKGYSITKHINNVRIEQAKLLLQTPEITVMDVAYRVGYNDRSYFNKVFKQITGLSPNEYRKKICLICYN